MFLHYLPINCPLCFNVPLHRQIKKKQNTNSQENSSHRSLREVIIYAIFIHLIMIYLAYALWESIMSVHITNLGIPFVAYSLLWTLNGAIIIVGPTNH